jgi:dihydrofolate reductase
MGRRTFQSLRKPLDGRDNIVVTRDPGFRPEGAIVEPSFEAALARATAGAKARGAGEIMVIGGADIFQAALALAGRIYKTEVRAPRNAYFPNRLGQWRRWRASAPVQG